MSNIEMKLDAIMRLCTTDDKQEAASIKADLRRMMAVTAPVAPKPRVVDAEEEILHILLELGTPDHLIGKPYLTQAILFAIEDRKYLDSITYGMYPAIATKFDTTSSRVERAIRHTIEVTWDRGDYDVFNRYFGNSISAEKGKPTNGEFIARIANVVKMRMINAEGNN